MTVHTTRKPAKMGLTDQWIAHQKSQRFLSGLSKKARKNYTGTVIDGDTLKANQQHRRVKYSEHGDFTNCYRGGFY